MHHWQGLHRILAGMGLLLLLRALTRQFMMESLHRILAGMGLLLLVVGAKLWLVEAVGSGMPLNDQLDAEGEAVLRPWVEDRFAPGALFTPHNEHRIVFTKLIALGMVALNGQWDAQIQNLLNAVLHATFLLTLLVWIKPHLPVGYFRGLAVVLTALWLLPLNWENTLQGFQSQVYLALWFSFLHVRGAFSSTRADAAWWLGQISGLLALGTMASGAFSSIAVLGALMWTVGQNRGINRLQVATAAFAGSWLLIGLLIQTRVPGHDPLQADHVGVFCHGLAQMQTWPLHRHLPFGFLLSWPLFGAAIWLLRQKVRSGFEQALLGLIFWFALNLAAMAFFRGNGNALASRHLDVFYVGLALQGIALATIPWLRMRATLFSLWAATLLVTVLGESFRIGSTDLIERGRQIERQERNMQVFLRDHDATRLRAVAPKDLPYPSVEVLLQRWSHSSIQSILPAAIRRPVPLEEMPRAETAHLPATHLPIIASSPTGAQSRPWTWRSERQSAHTSPVLRFGFTGALGDPAAAITMRLVSETDEVEVRPDGSARHRWKTINVMRPPGEWWIELIDSDGIDDIALTAPVELGRISWATEKLIKYHKWLAGVGIGLLLGTSLARVSPRAQMIADRKDG